MKECITKDMNWINVRHSVVMEGKMILCLPPKSFLLVFWLGTLVSVSFLVVFALSLFLSERTRSLSSRFLTYCPSKRIIADEALKHEYFRETPQPIDPSMFPTWPAKSEQQRVKRGTSPRPPEGGLGYSHLVRTLKSTSLHTATSCVK